MNTTPHPAVSAAPAGSIAVSAETTDASEPTSASASDPTPSEHHHGYIGNKDAYLKRLRRIEGQARGLQNMVADEKYCIDILTQISAMTSALESVALGLLDEHLNHCVVEAVAEGGPVAEEKLREASAAIARLVRS